MAFSWTAWQLDVSASPLTETGARDPKYATPYVDWFREKGGAKEAGVNIFPQDLSTAFIPLPVRNERARRLAGLAVTPRSPTIHDYMDGLFPALPLPSYAVRPGAEKIVDPKDLTNLSRIAVAPPVDSVIVGVIDAGFALAHDRFRNRDGSTRFLAHWDQGGVWDSAAPVTQTEHLPFGRELQQRQIDGLVAAHMPGDEDGFNRAAGLTNYASRTGSRALDRLAAHGTHVLDLATGGLGAQDQARDRRPAIAVSLPPRPSVGSAGDFLEPFVLWAIRYIVMLADRVWDVHHGGGAHAVRGYPIVLNLSYGRQAGPKDGTLALQRYLAALNQSRLDEKCAPVRIMMPAGNDNLERGTAHLTPGGVAPASLIWRLVPEDRTSSFAEIWTESLPGPQKPPDTPCPIAIGLTIPGGADCKPSFGKAGYRRDMVWTDAAGQKTVVARIYCRQSGNAVQPVGPRPPRLWHRFFYTICVAPSWQPAGVTAPPGPWTITLGAGAPMKAYLHVQSDEAPVVGQSFGPLSYFDHPDYRPFDADGRVMDTYRYAKPPVVLDDGTGPVSRQSTLNAIAGTGFISTIAGYQVSDGRPSDYSSTGRAPGVARPTAAFAADDGPAHPGRLAAGSRSGSAVVLQGTSFATAEATRWAVEDLLDWHRAGRDPRSLLGSSARLADTAAQSDSYEIGPKALSLKLGQGRMPATSGGRVKRGIRPTGAPAA